MSRLVVVANRVPNPKERGATAGGLAVALKDAMTGREAMWFGWSGQTADATASQPVEVQRGKLTYATLDLGREDYRRYYQGFANATLWPTLHYRLGLAQFQRADYTGYRAVNAAFAAALAPLLRPDDIIWTHDFHLFPFGGELRRLGCKQRQGFFLHVPFPPFALFTALPRAEELVAELAAYDVIGVQTEDDAFNLRAALVAVGQPEAAERVGAFPVGIDAEGFRRFERIRPGAGRQPALPPEPGGPVPGHRRGPAGLYQGPAAALRRLRASCWPASPRIWPRSPICRWRRSRAGTWRSTAACGASWTNGSAASTASMPSRIGRRCAT